ncbi:hypothetical protein BaRGS_00007414 [Batillaria attramentaria]|uniref:Uncharacterized protein n=1 Tax=Batillaria attramentaria TaxID=370345 RepID=A0ABD0LNR8_9CAEN
MPRGTVSPTRRANRSHSLPTQSLTEAHKVALAAAADASRVEEPSTQTADSAAQNTGPYGTSSALVTFKEENNGGEALAEQTSERAASAKSDDALFDFPDESDHRSFVRNKRAEMAQHVVDAERRHSVFLERSDTAQARSQLLAVRRASVVRGRRRHTHHDVSEADTNKT